MSEEERTSQVAGAAELAEATAEAEASSSAVALVDEAAATGAAAVEPEPKPEPEPEVKKPRARQWVNMRGSSMDLRCGVGNTGNAARDLRSAVGKPHACALAHDAGVDPAYLESLRRDLTDQGFATTVLEVPAGALDLPSVAGFDEALAKAGVTSDDLVCVVGRERTLSLASFACATWCGGVSLAQVPLDVVSALTCGVTPRALDLPGSPRSIVQEGATRFCICDLEVLRPDPTSEDARHGFALMVASAMGDSEKAFSRLWDRAEDLVQGDEGAWVDQLADTTKSRGRIVSSTALAVRQSVSYGQDFAYALQAATAGAVPFSTCLADGLRFSARIAVVQETLSIDDMFTQDELLERLGLPTCEVAVDAEALVDALKAERFARSRRFMLPIPRALGRVRPTVVEDDLLREHVAAWCETRVAE